MTWDGAIPENVTPMPATNPLAGMVIGATWEDDVSTEDAKPKFPDPFAP